MQKISKTIDKAGAVLVISSNSRTFDFGISNVDCRREALLRACYIMASRQRQRWEKTQLNLYTLID